MRSIVRGVVALVVALFMCRAVEAAPTIVSPADYSAFSTYSIAFKEILEEGSLGPDAYVSSTWSNPYFSYTDYSSGATAATSKRVADRLLMRDNALPVTLKWAGSAGQVVVKLWRTKKDSANNPQFTVTTTGTSAKFYDLEFGRNYTWTVTDSTGTATGHFYITNDSGAPRILLYDQDPDASGADTSNTRDMGGWRTTNGKVVKQGLIYRTGELEWCNPTDANGMRQELTYLKNTLGIKFDMDFRNYTDLQNKLAYVGENSITKHGWRWAWKNGSYLNLNESNIGEGVVRLNINKLTGVQFGSYTGLVPKKSATADENKNNRKNVWCAFTNLANSANWPMVFHCSHGKDRAGTFALVIQGVLGVPKEAALKDYAISWFDSPDEKLGPSSISNTCAHLATYVSGSNLSTTYFKDQCINFLVQCGKDAGLSETTAQNKITAFQNAMLEDPEMPDLNPNLTSEPETDGDTFTYVNLYHRRQAGGGSLASDNGSTLSYMYTTETGESTHPAISKFNNYNASLYFYPTAGLPYSSPVCGYAKVGKVVTNGRYSPAAVGPYNFKAYFSSDGHTKTSRTIIEHRAGLAEYENVDLYFTEYNSSNLGEGGRNLAYVYTGDSAAIEIWANATMRIMDMRDMSQKRTTKGYKAYIKFPKGRCANARLEAMEIDGDGENLLGWFTGGEAGTRQYMKVSNSILQFNAPSKTSTVEGSLGLEFSLGDVITTSSAAMLKVASKLVIPAGSTLTVNAGRKGAGTYKLISAGTLTDNANLALRANYKVDNCKIGYYGTIVNEGNNINLVIQEGTEPDEESVIDPEVEGDWGYRLKVGNEVVLAFTNHTKSVNWKVPANIVNARFLVVGGGGGGGADNTEDSAFGGAGGGGGGVVTGNISLNADDFVSIFVGAGGAGGTVETDKSTSITTESCFGASAKGKESKITVNNIDYVKAFGGGQDQGVSSSSASGSTTVSGTPHVGGLGGSNAGSRGGYASEQAAINLDNVGYVANFEALSNCQRYGNIGGMGSQEIYYGHPAAGGGGGATEPGGNAGNKADGWPAGKGGEGLASDITGTMLVYGSGGGGASGQGSLGGVGGTGAGDGGDRADSQGTSAVANQGGGGGGSSRETTSGGNGGSGIVVIRYVEEAGSPDDPDEPGDEPQEPESNIPVIDSKWGYVKTGLGALGNEVAVVFTNHTEEATWTVPEDIENVQFLVVGGGGGGGGAVNSSKGGAGGAGGGGGCVVTGIVNQLAKDAVVSVQVGNGGAGGTYYSSETQGKGNASHGGNTYFKVGDVTYVTAYGGAGDLGYNKNSGVNNGSNSGSRLYDSATASSAVGTAATWNQSELADKLSNVNTFRNKGGYNPGMKGSASGGGGGAIAAGANVASSAYGGSGGAGLMTDITGDGVMFGSGGGGGTSRGANTTGYDSRGGGDDDDAGFCGGAGGGKVNGNGEDALVNQGGGGGGAGWGGNGGNGGSGIVVFRYTLKTEVKVDAAEYIESKIFDKHYTGLLQTSGLTEDEAYTVSEVGGTDVGVYEVVVTLKDGFAWADGDSNKSRTFTWNILKEPNNWKTPLALSATSWAQHYAANVKFVQPVQTVGELNATITKDGVTEAFGGTLPVDPGVYTLKYWVEEDALNYNGCSAEVTFTVYRSEAIDGGYKVFGLGENGNEEAMVFTQSGNWTLDATLSNVRFLVVGGGGGGGADCSASAEQRQGGSGGGGGGVVTGVANLVKGQTLAITVGQGGQGGVRGGSSPYGAVASQATDSSFAINSVTAVTAYAGGGDAGSTSGSSDTSGGQTGGAGGSSAGSRATASGRGEATRGAVVESDAIVSYEMFGEQGGAGADKYQAGGGGGATEEGSAGTSDNGGKGGEGLASDIAGTMLVYGSGGGGGAVAGGAQGPGLGGTGAGNGGQYNEATSAVANQGGGGGGGGGGGRVGNGGNGGSGIVVFRYVVLKSPTIGDSPVDAAEVFEIAKVSKPVLYPSEPEVSTNTVDGVKVVTVAFGGVNAPVPDCYDVIKSVTDNGYQISLVIKDEFKNPLIANSADDKTPAIKIEDGKVKIHLEGTHGRLHYSLMTSTWLESSESWTTAKGDWSDNANFEFGDGVKKLDDARFFKVGEVSDEPIE